MDAVVCWHVDRLTRTPRELEDVIDLADKRGLELATISGEIDIATPTGRLIARILSWPSIRLTMIRAGGAHNGAARWSRHRTRRASLGQEFAHQSGNYQPLQAISFGESADFVNFLT